MVKTKAPSVARVIVKNSLMSWN